VGGAILRFCVIPPHTECRFSKMEMIKSSQRTMGEGKAGARVKSLTVAMSSSAERSAVGKYTCGKGGEAPRGDAAGGAVGERMHGSDWSLSFNVCLSLLLGTRAPHLPVGVPCPGPLEEHDGVAEARAVQKERRPHRVDHHVHLRLRAPRARQLWALLGLDPKWIEVGKFTRPSAARPSAPRASSGRGRRLLRALAHRVVCRAQRCHRP